MCRCFILHAIMRIIVHISEEVGGIKQYQISSSRIAFVVYFNYNVFLII
jgi:hypothetical protein